MNSLESTHPAAGVPDDAELDAVELEVIVAEDRLGVIVAEDKLDVILALKVPIVDVLLDAVPVLANDELDGPVVELSPAAATAFVTLLLTALEECRLFLDALADDFRPGPPSWPRTASCPAAKEDAVRASASAQIGFLIVLLLLLKECVLSGRIWPCLKTS